MKAAWSGAETKLQNLVENAIELPKQRVLLSK